MSVEQRLGLIEQLLSLRESLTVDQVFLQPEQPGGSLALTELFVRLWLWCLQRLLHFVDER